MASRPYSIFPMLRAKTRSEEHTSELQSQSNFVCRLLLDKKQVCITGWRIGIEIFVVMLYFTMILRESSIIKIYFGGCIQMPNPFLRKSVKKNWLHLRYPPRHIPLQEQQL